MHIIKTGYEYPDVIVHFPGRENVIQWGPIPLFKSSREYYKQRMKGEMPDGTIKIVAAPRKLAGGAEDNA